MEALAATLLPDISDALSGITDALVPKSVDERWRQIPAFTLLFGAIFGTSAMLWERLPYVDRDKAMLLASCVVSAFHSVVCILVGYYEMQNWHVFKLDRPNTSAEILLMQFSFGYMIEDFLYMLIMTPDDILFLGHHVVSTVYLYAVLHNKVGAITAILTFFLGELTTPWLNIYTISKYLRNDNKVANKVFVYSSPVFTALFLLVRSLVAPWLVGWFIYTLWFRTYGIPVGWRALMGTLVLIGIAGSQLWSYKLVRGIIKRRRQSRKVQMVAKRD